MQEKELIILAIYVNVDGMSRHGAETQLQYFIDAYQDLYNDTDKNVKVYWLPITKSDTRVECVYPPPSIQATSGDIENELLKLYKLLLSSKDSDMKNILKNFERKIKLSKLDNKIQKQ